MPRCPLCKDKCTPIKYENVPVHHCGNCGGYWVTKIKLDRICELREIEMPEAVKQKMMDIADESNSTQKLWCHSCGCEMVKEQFKYWDDIQIDHCPRCDGIWLDRGELEKCQVYWEYLQDHPEQWEGQEVIERKALLEAQFQQRHADVMGQAEMMKNIRVPKPGLALLLSWLSAALSIPPGPWAVFPDRVWTTRHLIRWL